MSDDADLDAAIQQLETPKRDPHVGRRVAAGLTRMVNLPALYTLPGTIGAAVDPEEAARRAERGENPPYALPGHAGAEKASQAINTGINDLYGIDDPQTPIEWAAELSTAVIPSRWASAATLIAKTAPQMTKTQQAAKIVDALVVPGVQGKYTAPRVAANFGIPYGGIQGLLEASEETPGQQHTIIDAFTGEKTNPDADLDLALGQLQQEPQGDLDADIAELDLAQDAEEDRDSGLMEKAAVAGLVVIGARHLAGRRKARAIADMEKRAAEPSLFEPRTGEGIAKTGDLAVGNVFDEMEPLAKTLERNAGKEAGELFRAQARLGNQIGVASKHEVAYTSGSYPIIPGIENATQIKGRPLQDLMFAMDQLDDVGKKAIDESLAVMDELDQLKLTHGRTLSDTTPSIYGGRTKRELEALLTKHMQDPRIAGVVREFQQQPRTMLDYAQQGQLLSASKVRELKQAHPNFMPRDDYEVPRLRDILLGKRDAARDAIEDAVSPFERARSTDKARGVEFSANFLPPSQRLVEMQRRLIKAAEVNNMRRVFFDSVVGEDGKSRISGIYKVPPERVKRLGADELVKLRRNGEDEYWRVKDPTLRRLLQQGGQGVPLSSFFSAMNKMRQVKQFMTTGPILNPAFQAVAGQVWEPLWAIVNTPKGIKTPSPLVGMAGMVRGMRAAHAQRLSQFYRQEFMLRELGIDKAGPTSPLGKLWAGVTKDTRNLTPEQLNALSTSYADAYAKSAVHMYRTLGGGGTQAFQDLAFGSGHKLNVVDAAAVRKLKESLRLSINPQHLPDQYGPNMARQRGAFSHYARAMLDAVHNGTRYELFAKNMPKIPDGAPLDAYIDDLARVAFKTRDLMDMSAHGYGKAITGANATVPYFNAFLQGFYRFGKQWKERPARTTAAMSAVASAAALNTWLMSRDERYRDWYWNELTPEKRSGIVIPMGDDPRDSVIIPLDPIIATQWNIGQNLFDASFGISTGMIDPNVAKSLDRYFGVEDEQGLTPFERRQYDASASGKRLLGLAQPPALEVGAAMAGKRMRDWSFSDQSGQDVQQFNPDSRVPTKYVRGVIDAQTDAVMGGLFGVMATSYMVDFIEALNMKMGQKGTDLWESIGYGWDQVSSSYGGRAAGMDAATSSYNVDARVLKEYGESFRRMESKWNDVNKGGLTRASGGVPLLGATPSGFDDPVQAAMFDFFKPRYDGIKQIFEQSPNGLNDLMKQRQSVASDPRRSATQKRQDINAINEQIMVLQSEYLRAIEILEDETGQRFMLDDFDLRRWEGDDFKAPPPLPVPGAAVP